MASRKSSSAWARLLAVTLAPPPFPPDETTVTTLPFSACAPMGRLAQSKAFFSTADGPQLYSGAASSSASADDTAARSAATAVGAELVHTPHTGRKR